MILNAQNCPTPLLPDRWAYAFIERQRTAGDVSGRWEIIDVDAASEKAHGSSLCYPNEAFGSIRRTCLVVAATLPIYGVAYAAWHLVRAPFSAVSIFFYNVEEMLTRPGLSVLANLARQPIQHIGYSLWMVVRTPFCMIAMQSAALYGLINPLEGRQLCGALERYWRGGEAPFSLDFHSGYLVKSFQPYGTLKDPSIVSVQFAVERSSVG